MTVQVSRCCGSCALGMLPFEGSRFHVECEADNQQHLLIEVCSDYERQSKWDAYDDAFGPQDDKYNLE
jgi:hypothetical protein